VQDVKQILDELSAAAGRRSSRLERSGLADEVDRPAGEERSTLRAVASISRRRAARACHGCVREIKCGARAGDFAIDRLGRRDVERGAGELPRSMLLAARFVDEAARAYSRETSA